MQIPPRRSVTFQVTSICSIVSSDQIFFVHTMGSDLAMRLRTLIELLAALILTFAALFAVSKMEGQPA
jgi:hypothetical protein